jgi:Major intrinsic protein
MSRLAGEPETGTGRLQLDLTRRLVAEALGTGFLVVAVVGSGIMASRLSPDDVGLQLLENAAATAGALVALIWMLGAVSGAHFNPVVTLIDRSFGAITNRDTGLYIAAQVLGGCLGAVVANLMFDLPAVDWSTKERSSGALWLSEVRPQWPRQRRRRRRRRLDRRRLLLHLLHQLRQPRRHHRPHAVGQLRRHQAVIGSHVHRDAAGRRRRRLRAHPFPLSDRAHNRLRIRQLASRELRHA